MDNKRPNNKPQMNMPRFNMNWIYGLVIIALITLYFTQGNEKSSVRTETSYSDFKTMVMKGYADKIVVNKYENILQMYVKPEHIRDVFHQGVEQTGKTPSVNVAIGSVDQVEQFVNEAREQGRHHLHLDIHHAPHGRWSRWRHGWRHLQRRQVEGPDV